MGRVLMSMKGNSVTKSLSVNSVKSTRDWQVVFTVRQCHCSLENNNGFVRIHNPAACAYSNQKRKGTEVNGSEAAQPECEYILVSCAHGPLSGG
jgi:hypothetical protein